MFKVGDKVVYRYNPEGDYFGEYEGENIDIEGQVFEVVKLQHDGCYMVFGVSSELLSYEQIIDPKHLTLFEGDSNE